jgi:hypothetical protein
MNKKESERLSAVPPEIYQKRFMNFVDNNFMKPRQTNFEKKKLFIKNLKTSIDQYYNGTYFYEASGGRDRE